MRSQGQSGGRIEEDGLILYLDALSSYSYPGSGNTWFDISGNGNNFTLFNSPTYNGRTFAFNGSTQYGQCVNTTFGNFGTGSFTVEYAYNVTASQLNGPVLMKKNSLTNNTTTINQPGWAFNPENGAFRIAPTGAFGVDFIYSPSVLSTNVHIAHTIERDGVSLTGSIYINGELEASSQTVFSLNNSIDNTLPARLMFSSGDTDYRSGSLYFTRAYNKVLTASEILQNYQATRGRLGYF